MFLKIHNITDFQVLDAAGCGNKRIVLLVLLTNQNVGFVSLIDASVSTIWVTRSFGELKSREIASSGQSTLGGMNFTLS